MEDRIKELTLLKSEISKMIDDMIYDEQCDCFTRDNMSRLIQFLTMGVNFSLAELPSNDKTAILLNGLKEHGFVANNTRLEHFRVIFCIPLHKKHLPFEPIKLKKNKQLLRFFIYKLFPKETICINIYSIVNLFTNTHGELIKLPKSDKKRLEQSSDYQTLTRMLKIFNE